MKLKYLILTVAMLTFYIPSILCQKVLLGGIGGVTFTHITAITTINDTKETTLPGIGNAKGLAGFHIGVFGNYYQKEYFFFRGEFSYELLRFHSDLDLFEIGKIHHIKTGVLLGLKPLKWWVLTSGGEIVLRSNSTSGTTLFDGLNGLAVKGFYFQGILGTSINLKNNIQIGLRMTIPRISSLTRRFIGDPTDERLLVEQLRGFQLSMSVPFFKR